MNRLEEIYIRNQKRFPTEQSAEEFLYQLVWRGRVPWCQRCGNPVMSSWLPKGGRNRVYKCSDRNCNAAFTTKSLTPFKHHISPLVKLFSLAEYLLEGPRDLSYQKIEDIVGIDINNVVKILNKIELRIGQMQTHG